MKLIRKLIVGISTLCLLVMTFVSATYAWFEINSKASVENFHFEVHGGQGFLVSIDNINYDHDLTLVQLQKAMLVSYGNGSYRIADDGSENLYYNGGDGEVVISDDRIGELVSEKIKLLPATTIDGRYLTDLDKGETKVTSGAYLEFNVYFRATSRRIQDDFAYDIYLNGEDSTTDDGSLVEPTYITSQITTFGLSANMNACIPTNTGKYVTALKRKNADGQRDNITVYSSNAVRLSITNNTYEEYDILDEYNNPVLDEEGNQVKGHRYVLSGEDATKIYELNDTLNPNTDLGSYATDYNGGLSDEELDAMIVPEGTLIEDENLALYCSRFNAMFTYYNNLKPDAQISPLEYDKMPTTIRTLTSNQIITRVKAGEEAQLLTFRLWLEGWDADCFDGIKYAIKARLAFGSKRVEL